MNKKYKSKIRLNSAEYEIIIPSDLITMEYSTELTALDFNIISYLQYNAKKQHNSRYYESSDYIKNDMDKFELFNLLKNEVIKFDMTELIHFVGIGMDKDKRKYISKRLKNIDKVTVNTNVFNKGVDTIKKPTDPKQLSLILNMNYADKTYKLDADIFYKLLYSKPPYSIVRLTTTVHLMDTQSKLMYQIIIDYQSLKQKQITKTINQWKKALNLPKSFTYPQQFIDRVDEIANEVHYKTPFSITNIYKDKDSESATTMTIKFTRNK